MSTTASRRGFFAGGIGAMVGLFLPRRLRGRVRRGGVEEASRTHQPAGSPQQVDAEARLRALGLQLPPAPRPVATYVMTTLVGNLLFVAGHTPRNPDGSPGHQGKVGRDLTVAQGQAAARVVALNTLASVRQAVGSLNRVVRLVRTFGMVNATPDFGDHPQVMNGFSDLIVQIFGETAGRGTRAAVGMGSLPSGMSVEVETVWEVRS